MGPKQNILTPEQIQAFRDDGILVVPNILSWEEVQISLSKLSETLHQYGVDMNDLKSTGHNLVKLSSTNGSGGVLDLFYPSFKLDIGTKESLFYATCELWECCFRNDKHEQQGMNEIEDCMEHPFESFPCDRGYMYIDRIGFRLPTQMAEEIGQRINDDQSQRMVCSKKKKRTKLAIQRSLTPHLDCCPETFNTTYKKSKWRPIQCFVSLTDNIEPNTGGFEAVRGGFHKEFNQWIETRQKTRVTKGGKELEIEPPCMGEYTHIRPKEDVDIMKRIEHIPVKAGSAVFWDNRIPHANAYMNNSDHSRIVVYCSFLPDIALNRDYVRKQLDDYQLGRIPRDQWIEKETEKRNLFQMDANQEDNHIEEQIDTDYVFTKLGKQLMMIDKW